MVQTCHFRSGEWRCRQILDSKSFQILQHGGELDKESGCFISLVIVLVVLRIRVKEGLVEGGKGTLDGKVDGKEVGTEVPSCGGGGEQVE